MEGASLEERWSPCHYTQKGLPMAASSRFHIFQKRTIPLFLCKPSLEIEHLKSRVPVVHLEVLTSIQEKMEVLLIELKGNGCSDSCEEPDGLNMHSVYHPGAADEHFCPSCAQGDNR